MTAVGSLFQYPDGDGVFECIVLSHVLEHVYELADAIKTVREILAKDGFLYVEVPNAQRYADYYVSPFHYFDTEHINHFSPASMVALLRRLHLTPVALGEKETAVTDRVVYPAFWIIAKRTLDCPGPLAFDDALVDGVLSYIALSESDRDVSVIEGLVASQRPLVVWGRWVCNHSPACLHRPQKGQHHCFCRQRSQMVGPHPFGSANTLATRSYDHRCANRNCI